MLLNSDCFLSYLTLLTSLQIRNPSTNLCLDTMGRKAGGEVGLVACHGMMGNQVSFYPWEGWEGEFLSWWVWWCELREFSYGRGW